MTGVGRIIRTAPGWLAAATDRQIVLCDLRRNTSRRLDVSLVQLTHLAIKPDEFGLALIQERDRIGRLTPAGRWVWKHELRSTVEDLAIGPRGFAAVSTNSGQLLIFDAAGEATPGFAFDATDAPLLIEAPEGSPAGVTWFSLARRSQWLRGHSLTGEVLWDRPIPWEGWALFRVGRARDRHRGRRASPYVRRLRSISSRKEVPPATPTTSLASIPPASPIRISRRGVHLICATLDGQVRWRAVVDQPLGPLAAGMPGTVVFVGKSLAWFQNDRPTDTGCVPLADLPDLPTSIPLTRCGNNLPGRGPFL